MTQIIEHDLGHQKRGATAVVTLKGNAANVRLMDSSNLSAFKRGRQHHYRGGLVRRSPHRIPIPSDGRWYITVDLIGMRPGARVDSSVGLEPPPLPMARSAPAAPLTEVHVERPPAGLDHDGRSWDVFISHAWEDKAEIARPLYEALTGFGVSVWFDEGELRIGDSLRRKIDQGIANSAFGVVILSSSFFAKGWPHTRA